MCVCVYVYVDDSTLPQKVRILLCIDTVKSKNNTVGYSAAKLSKFRRSAYSMYRRV
jgi:hypothetical protein